MKKLFIFIVACIFLNIGCDSQSKSKEVAPIIHKSQHTAPFEAVVTYVYDGDTVKVKSQGVDVKIRLFGIDAPEKKQPFGKASTENLRKLIKSRRVIIEPVEMGRYGRLIAKIYKVKKGVKIYVNLKQGKGGFSMAL